MKNPVIATLVLMVMLGGVESFADDECDAYGSYNAIGGVEHDSSWESATDLTPSVIGDEDDDYSCNVRYYFDLDLTDVDGIEGAVYWSGNTPITSYSADWSYFQSGWHEGCDTETVTYYSLGNYTKYAAVQTSTFNNGNPTDRDRMLLEWYQAVPVWGEVYLYFHD